MKNKKKPLHYFLLLCLLVSLCVPVLADDNAAPDKVVAPTLKKAVMCEGVQDGLPVDQTIIFDVSKASAYCWSEFDPVSADGVVYHEWYRSGVLISKVKLAVHPPRWAAYSSLRLRQADTGPWYLNITDENGKILKTLRFSITE